MAEGQQNLSDAENVQPPRVLLTPEQIDQIQALQAMIEQCKPIFDAAQDPKAKAQLASPPPVDTSVPLAETSLPLPKPATPSLDVQNSKDATALDKVADDSSNATQGSSWKLQDSKIPKTRYEFDRNNNGNCIRRYRKRPPPYDPKKDPCMIAHVAAHNVCSKIVQAFGLTGEW
jgi:hypothetical protein